MSRSDGRATLQNFQDFAQNIENCMRKLNIYAFLPLFSFFFFTIHTYYVILGVNFALFSSAKFLKLKFGPRKKSTFRMSGVPLDLGTETRNSLDPLHQSAT